MRRKYNLSHFVQMALKYSFGLSQILIGGAAFCVFYNVARRYLFDDPSIIAYELAKMFLVGSLVFSMGFLERIEGNINIDILLKSLSDKKQEIIKNFLTPCIGLVYTLAVTYQGWKCAWDSFRIGERSHSAWGEPLWPIKLTIPIGYGILSLVLLLKLMEGLKQRKKWKRG